MNNFKDRPLRMCALLTLLCVALLPVNLFPRSRTGAANVPPSRLDRATVIATDDAMVRRHVLMRTGQQGVTVRMDDGPHRGKEFTTVNLLSGRLDLDELYRPGDRILVEYEAAATEGAVIHPRPRGPDRLRPTGALVALFAALLLGLAGLTGLKALLSFVFSALVLWKVFFPLLLRGAPPLLAGLAVTALLTAVIAFAVGGMNRRGLATFLGSMAGVATTCGLALIFTRAFRLHGAVRPFSETLLYAGYSHLDLTQIFMASIFVAASGALMDLAMDIAAAMEEIKIHSPGIGARAHCAAGIRVGRAVIGTMTTTLLLAYSGSHITMFLLFMARGLPLLTMLNAPMVAAEVMNILIGSFGLITAAPFTAIVAAILYRDPRGSSKTDAAASLPRTSDPHAPANPS